MALESFMSEKLQSLEQQQQQQQYYTIEIRTSPW